MSSIASVPALFSGTEGGGREVPKAGDIMNVAESTGVPEHVL